MLNPSNDSRSPLSSRIALPVALLLAGVFGLAVAWVQPSFTLSKKGAAPIAHRVSENPGTTSNQPSGTMPATGGEDLIAFCSRHVTATRSFVVFKHGTCVVINEPCDEPMTKAKEVLARCTDPSAAFLTEPTTDGDARIAWEVTVADGVERRPGTVEILVRPEGTGSRVLVTHRIASAVEAPSSVHSLALAA